MDGGERDDKVVNDEDGVWDGRGHAGTPVGGLWAAPHDGPQIFFVRPEDFFVQPDATTRFSRGGVHSLPTVLP